MSVLRWMARISLAEWILIGALVALLWRRRPQAAVSAAPGTRSWALDACVAIAVIGILAGAIWRLSWLSLVGFAAAALGIGLMIRGWGFTFRRWLSSFLGRR